MSLPAPESSTPAQRDARAGDVFANCARRITSLLCGSADVNGGRTMADWERFLRTSENPGCGSFHQRILTAHERFIRSQQENNYDSKSSDNQEACHASDIHAELQKDNNQSSNDVESSNPESLQFNVCDRSENTVTSTCDPAGDTCDSTLQDLESILSRTSVTGRGSCEPTSTSVVSSDINSTITTVDSRSSCHPSELSDGMESVCVEESISSQAVRESTENHANGCIESVISSTSSTALRQPGRKRFLNWFRNPWHVQSRSINMSAMTMAEGVASDETLDFNRRSASRRAMLLMSPKFIRGSPLFRQLNIDLLPSDVDDQGRSANVTEAEDCTQQQGTSEEQDVFSSPMGSFPDYGRGSPDGLSSASGRSTDESSASEEIVIIEDESDPEIQEVFERSNREAVLLNYEQDDLSRPPSVVSVESSATGESYTEASWMSDPVEEEVVALEEAANEVLGMLPAGYHRADDNLFRRGNSMQALLRQLQALPSESESEWMHDHHPVPHPLPQEAEQPSGGSPYLVTTVNAINALECPVCFTYMQHPPIWLCVNGHNMCGRCQQRVVTCPLCRGRLLFTRNLALEAIASDLAFKQQQQQQQNSDAPEESEKSIKVVPCRGKEDEAAASTTQPMDMEVDTTSCVVGGSDASLQNGREEIVDECFVGSNENNEAVARTGIDSEADVTQP